jgi:hypothetical protein
VHDQPVLEHATRQSIEPSHTAVSAMGGGFAPG